MRGCAWLLLGLVACGDNAAGEDRLGGKTTVVDRSATAFTHPAANLDATGLDTFASGRSPFQRVWEPQFGLGPQFNNDACFGCHGGNGRGRAQIGGPDALVDQNGPLSEALVRTSLLAGNPAVPGGDVPLPGFGLQLHDHAVAQLPQVIVDLSYQLVEDAYPDGTPYELRVPVLDIHQPDGSPLPPGALTSFRTAPESIGLGLLEAIPEATLVALADPSDADGDGIKGHINYVWNPETGQTEVGRFGWKANAPTLHVQVAGAAFNDIGLTNALFPPVDGSDKDLSDDQLEQMTFMVQTIGVPAAAARDDAAWKGRELFDEFACSKCHVATLVTGAHPVAQVAHQTIHPFTDLLLHDMGDGLADNRPDFEASGHEWRTTPLWGIGLAQVVRPTVTFLHDGRARSIEEAILWHGGEAMAAQTAFRTATAADRAALLAFLQTL